MNLKFIRKQSNLHRIPNLSEKFLYFNDDIALLKPVCPSDFFTNKSGYKVYLELGFWSKTPSRPKIFDLVCPKQCLYRKNLECNEECNRIECLYDDNKCDGKDNPEYEIKLAKEI